MNKTDILEELACTDTQFDSIHEALDKTRATSATVKVDRAALAALLRDHSRLFNFAARRAA